ncbi:hypothetical protein IT397_00665 [Candidatus Nomurabacteria bacterium]|nr:hypothetical protein [Candidatus Nomurabacteria bacterium]
METITSKRQFMDLWRKGLLGNRPRIWDTLREVKASGFSGLLAIRYIGLGGGGPFVVNLKLGELESEMRRIVKAGWSESQFCFIEQITPGMVTYIINGEICRKEDGFWLHFSTENKFMRPALSQSPQNLRNLEAQMMLRKLLWPTDYEELMGLLEQYPDHVVEFSGFDRCVGIVPNRRMIIWEVRKY